MGARREFPRLCAIADAGLLHPTPLHEGARRLAEGGARWIQLRGKSLSSGAFYEETVRAIAALRPLGALVIVNDRVDVARAAGADGVHLGQTDLFPREARRILGDRAIVGLSTHDLAQALRGAEEPVDYLAVGPVFPTRTKENPDPVVGLSLVTAVRGAVPLPLVAIGGIGAGNVRRVLASGADAVAVISALLEGGDPALGVRDLLRAIVVQAAEGA